MKNNYHIVFIFIALTIGFANCHNYNQKTDISGKRIRIQYLKEKKLNENNLIIIDGFLFSHTYYYDSLSLAKYLPGDKKIVVIEPNKKVISEKNNPQYIALILAEKLIRQGQYKINNKALLLTQGILDFSKKNNENINIQTNKNYPAIIKVVNQ